MELEALVHHLPLQVGVPQLRRRAFLVGQLALEVTGDRPVEVRPADLELGLVLLEDTLVVVFPELLGGVLAGYPLQDLLAACRSKLSAEKISQKWQKLQIWPRNRWGKKLKTYLDAHPGIL